MFPKNFDTGVSQTRTNEANFPQDFLPVLWYVLVRLTQLGLQKIPGELKVAFNNHHLPLQGCQLSAEIEVPLQLFTEFIEQPADKRTPFSRRWVPWCLGLFILITVCMVIVGSIPCFFGGFLP
jgi:hypothetical protein